jgi:hypothetical protein
VKAASRCASSSIGVSRSLNIGAARPSVSLATISFCVVASVVPFWLFVTTGHSRSKNGVASLAYDPVVHAERQQTKRPKFGASRPAPWIAGSSPAMTTCNLVLAARLRARALPKPLQASPSTKAREAERRQARPSTVPIGAQQRPQRRPFASRRSTARPFWSANKWARPAGQEIVEKGTNSRGNPAWLAPHPQTSQTPQPPPPARRAGPRPVSATADPPCAARRCGREAAAPRCRSPRY